MLWTVDHIIFFGFLILNIIFGLKSSKGIATISQYAIGDRNFSTGTLVATTISGIIGVCGIIAIQFKVAGLVFEYLLNMPKFQGIFLIGVVVILYSTMGGIKSVTFTDMIQFLTFGTIIPIMTYYFFNNLPDSYNSVVNALSNQPKYNLGNIFDISKASFWNNLSLFFI